MVDGESQFQTTLTRRLLLVGALLLAMLGQGTASFGATESVTRSYSGGITQAHTIHYNIKSSCGAAWTGAGYQLYKTTNRWTRSDSSLTARNMRGTSGYIGNDCSNASVSASRTINGPDGILALNTTYTTNHSYPYIATPGDCCHVGSLVRTDIWRAGRKIGELCTRVYINQTNSC